VVAWLMMLFEIQIQWVLIHYVNSHLMHLLELDKFVMVEYLVVKFEEQQLAFVNDLEYLVVKLVEHLVLY
jgi:hypothetical protein